MNFLKFMMETLSTQPYIDSWDDWCCLFQAVKTGFHSLTLPDKV